MSPRSHFFGSAWLDSDGLHVVSRHACLDGDVTTTLPYPTWSVDKLQVVRPSINCTKCGYHAFPVAALTQWEADRG